MRTVRSTGNAMLWVPLMAVCLRAQATTAPSAPSAPATTSSLRGDPAAIADAEAMVEAMGGREIWANIRSIHFVHEWSQVSRVDRYVENEILDLEGPRSWVEQRSEIHRYTRAYSPEGRRWSITDGVLTYASADALTADLKRAPFNFYRLVHGVAAGDAFYEVTFGQGDIPGTRRLEFRGPDGALGGWVILNARKEPIVKATPAYRYTLGPLHRYGNLWIPAWGVYDNGLTQYEVSSVSADRIPPDAALFRPPGDSVGRREREAGGIRR